MHPIQLNFVRRLAFALLILAQSFVAGPLVAQDVAVDPAWRYTLQPPEGAWQQPQYDDSQWMEGFGGFGTRGTPGSRVGTVWSTKNIWLRRTIELEEVPARPALLVHHDEDLTVYINGQRVTELKGFITDYRVVPLEPANSPLRAGTNVIAVHCRQTGGGQFVDVHVIDADKVPQLPQPPRPTTPFKSELLTQWGAGVTPENAWREYPRPALARQQWLNLNGHWDYAITARDATAVPEQWNGQILVPFALESRLSGVQRLLDASEALWYHRQFELPASPNRRTLLNFEAVDYRCRVWVNGTEVGGHTGGNTPFSFDVTAAARPGSNTLIVRVEDDTEGYQLSGKQRLNPEGIWYTQVSGIWQSVWLEQVAPRYIADLKTSTDAATGSISVRPVLAGSPVDQERVQLTVRDGNQTWSASGSGDQPLDVKVPGAKLWSPATPHLYNLTVEVLGPRGEVLDSVSSYAGIRTVGKTRDADGHWRFTLNGEILFHWGPLDQGWWPDGLLTPPSDAGMLYDIEFLKAAGFNMIRKHIKVEPRRYYYHCDRLGMMVWQDQVSAGQGPDWTRLAPNPRDAQWSDADHAQFMLEFERMVSTLENHPSIVVWVPFNEAWGQHRTLQVGQWIRQRDPTRLVNIASGGNFWPVGDVVDEHQYPHPGFPFDPSRYVDFIKVVGEFGGHGLPIAGHLWDENRDNWGYGGLPKNAAEYRERYVESLRRLAELRAQGIAAGVYTQTTDVEGEINGLLTYDRAVAKLSAEELKQIHTAAGLK
jgi:hypothetical protein